MHTSFSLLESMRTESHNLVEILTFLLVCHKGGGGGGGGGRFKGI